MNCNGFSTANKDEKSLKKYIKNFMSTEGNIPSKINTENLEFSFSFNQQKQLCVIAYKKNVIQNKS